MKTLFGYLLLMTLTVIVSCNPTSTELKVEIYQTSANGYQHTKIEPAVVENPAASIVVKPEEKFQTITGFGGSFTESSAYLLNQLSPENRTKIMQAYFGEDGAKYSLTRTHINSCDFSLGQYAYVKEADPELKDFSIEEDRDDIIKMIKEAQGISKDGFKIISSPWTAPPWMKDNNAWVGGKLLKEHYPTWALYFSKYIQAYKVEGIDVWGVTFENEPLGNGNNWESMHFSPEEMVDFVQNHLGPQLEKDGLDVKILGYDQNRGEELKIWVDKMYENDASSKYFAGTAVHWYSSTVDYLGESLEYAHNRSPEKHLIQTEGCVDSEIPHWKDDKWYWSKEATDWGWDWAPEDQKKDHPKYVPVYRYARDMIGSLNSHVDGWVDWNMVLDRQGGPNWFKNWCVAPVIVDPVQDEVYFTPLYYVMVQFSRYIRPGAVRIGFENSEKELLVTGAQNPDGSIAVIVLNMGERTKEFSLKLGEKTTTLSIQGQALQTIIIPS